MRLTVAVSTSGVARALVFAALGLTLASSLGQLYRFGWEPNGRPGLLVIRLFDVDAEANVPTWYSSSILLLSAILLGLIAKSRRIVGARYVWHWRALSVVFLYLAIDEASHIHEEFGEFLRLKLVDTSFAGPFTWGGLHLTWESLAGVLVILFVVANLRFVAHLPPRTRTLFLLAGALYVGGALGVELIAELLFAHGGSDRTGSIVSHVEELFEMQGTATFVYALLAYVRSYVQELTIHLGA